MSTIMPESYGEGIAGLRRSRRLLFLARWLVIAGVVVMSELKYTTARVREPQIIAAILGIAALTGLVAVFSRRFRYPQGAIILAVADIATVSVIVFFSDGIQSPFFPLYYIALIEAAVTFGTRGGLICAAAVTALALMVEIADTSQALTEPHVIEDLVRTTPYLFLIAAITGVLRDRVTALAETATALRSRQEVVQREMDVARQVQMAQLPSEVPAIPGIEMMVIYQPAREVGGDLYDFFPVYAGHVGIVVADVAGKGVPAALLVSSTRYSVRNYYGEDKAAMMRGINRHIASVTSDESFVTMLYGMINTGEMVFRYVSAGHMPPIVVKGHTGDVICCESPDAPLGISTSSQFTEKTIALRPGDTLVLYTDGMTDALAPVGDGLTLLIELLKSLAGKSLPRWHEELMEAIRDPSKLDDVTVVAVRILGETGEIDGSAI